MTRRGIKSVIAGGMFVALATVASAGNAMALEIFRSYDAGYARWSSQEAGQNGRQVGLGQHVPPRLVAAILAPVLWTRDMR